IRTKPARVVITLILLVLLVLDLTGRVIIDAWAIVLLILIVAPWSLSTVTAAWDAFSDAFGRSNVRSVQIGNFKIEQLEHQVNTQAKQIEEHRQILDDFVLYSMAFYIYDKLKYLYLLTLQETRAEYGEYKYVKNDTFDRDLRYLRDHGYL